MQSSHSPATSRRNSSRPLRSVRQPVSCEPCRRRKIRCSRTTPPCDTCRRRSCLDSCIYLRYPHNAPSSTAATNTATTSQQELLNRIINLEESLRIHRENETRQSSAPYSTSSIDLSQQTVNSDAPSFPQHNLLLTPEITTPSTASPTTPEIGTPSTASSVETLSSCRKGVLVTSRLGFVKYERRSSQWASVLAKTNMSERVLSLSETEISEDAGYENFPLGSNKSTRDQLFILLPPNHQCSQLKDTFFEVFSPVRPLSLNATIKL